MQIAVITISESGKHIEALLQQELQAQTLVRTDVGHRWHDYNAFIFIGAMGICVRTIAPYVEDKHTDPAVVCIDSTGQHVVSVLSGHVGGANDLTRYVARLLHTEPVITTQSDNQGLWSLDTLASRFGWYQRFFASSKEATLNDCLATFVNGKPTALCLKIRDGGTDYLEQTLPPHVTLVKDPFTVKPDRFELYIVVSPFNEFIPIGVPMIHFVPRVTTVGFGLAHQAENPDEINQKINDLLADRGVLPESILDYCTIDVKADEPFVKRQQYYGHTIRFFTASELAQVPVPNPSEVVAHHVGTPSVSEAAALLGTQYGKLVIPKVKGSNFTVAAAINHAFLRMGHIEIVGAGPGDPDLISVRGRKMLEKADLILYAGSLVPKALTECHKPGAVVRSSADMNLEEQCQLMKEHYDNGHFIVRLHTGDPCIFGAIQEQMAFFDREGMSYHITPGISSFLAAAAELRSQFTIPERTQTIILTRGEGRTPMPEKEQLHLLAKSQSTMCIFLSAAIVDDVQRELLQEYPEDTPVAACYHLTWPDQKIFRGVLKDLAKMVHDNKLTLTTMLVVGEAIDNRQGLSELYSKHFTHLFRKGEP